MTNRTIICPIIIIHSLNVHPYSNYWLTLKNKWQQVLNTKECRIRISDGLCWVKYCWFEKWRWLSSELGYNLNFLTVDENGKGLIQTWILCCDPAAYTFGCISQLHSHVLEFIDLANICLYVGWGPPNVKQASINTVFQVNIIFVTWGKVKKFGDVGQR